MKKTGLIIPFLILGLMAGCSQEQETKQEESAKMVNVETKVLKPQIFERYLRLIGTVDAQNDIRISAEVSGRIEKYYVEKGDLVKKGQTIAKIDDSQLKQDRDRLEAVTAQSKENYERLKRLYEQDSVGSEMEYLNAKYTYQQNNASLKAVKVNLQKTTVGAPFNATVEDVLVEAGEMVSPGTVMVRLIGANMLKVSAGVPSRFSDVVTKGDRAQLWFDSQYSDTLDLPITFVGQSIDQQARTFEVEIALPKNTGSYKVDMVANIKLRTMQEDSALVVGEEFVYQKENGYVVYTVGQNEEGKPVAKERPVKLGASYENNVVIAQGLGEGEHLITVGSSFLQNDMRINIVEDTATALAQQN